MAALDNTFILELLPEVKPRFYHRLLYRTFSILNHLPLVKFSFKEDSLNRYFGTRYRFKENMLDGYQMNLEQAMNIYHLLSQVLLTAVPGDIVELGSYKGITAILLQKTLEQFRSNKQLHLFDSFQGLPAKTAKDGITYFSSGDCKSTIDELTANFKRYGVRLPIIHAGWFAETAAEQPGQIAFAHLDGDFYSSILESLQIVYPRLAPGAVVVIDDYCDPQLLDVNNILPGVKKACDEFFADKPEKVSVLIAGNESHGYFRKI